MHIYGIKNCNTLKKTLNWFDQNRIHYQFVDYKKNPPTSDLLMQFLAQHSWEIVVNKRGRTWSALDDSVKETINQETALALMLEKPSIIKRPIIEKNGVIYIGYNEDIFAQLI